MLKQAHSDTANASKAKSNIISFVNNIFEIEAGYSLPMDKAKLVE